MLRQSVNHIFTGEPKVDTPWHKEAAGNYESNVAGTVRNTPGQTLVAALYSKRAKRAAIEISGNCQ
jgi:hypothetical protein